MDVLQESLAPDTSKTQCRAKATLKSSITLGLFSSLRLRPGWWWARRLLLPVHMALSPVAAALGFLEAVGALLGGATKMFLGVHEKLLRHAGTSPLARALVPLVMLVILFTVILLPLTLAAPVLFWWTANNRCFM